MADAGVRGSMMDRNGSAALPPPNEERLWRPQNSDSQKSAPALDPSGRQHHPEQHPSERSKAFCFTLRSTNILLSIQKGRERSGNSGPLKPARARLRGGVQAASEWEQMSFCMGGAGDGGAFW